MKTAFGRPSAYISDTGATKRRTVVTPALVAGAGGWAA